MAVKTRTAETVDFNSLLVSLNNTGLQQKDPALYQTIKLLIEKSSQKQKIDQNIFRSVIGDVEVLDLPFDLTSIVENIQILLNASFITVDDETGELTDSRQLIAGTDITLDTSVAGEITINSTAATSDSISPFLLMGG